MPRFIARLASLLAGVALAVLLCAGCQQERFTRENYDTIHATQPAADVRRVLGDPERSTPEHWDYVRRRPTHYEARIWFRDGNVARKEWFDRKELFPDGR